MKMLLITAAVIVTAVPLVAHHGAATFDTEKELTLKGTVTEWIWANPHCWLKFDSKDENGEVQHWIVEASNPPDMTRQGWAKNSFKLGDEVVVTMMRPKNGAPGIGRFSGPNSVVLNGQPFPSGVASNAQPAAKP